MTVPVRPSPMKGTLLNTHTKLRAAAIAMALTAVVAACGGDDDDAEAVTTEAAAEAVVTEAAAEATEAAAEPGATEAPAAGAACGTGATKVGFIYVGSKDDFGYNQAAYEGADAAGTAAGVEVLHAENVPETIEDAVPVMEDMIAQGATVIFATSYGHFPAAVEVATSHPDVCVLHQGQFESSLDAPLDNFGTYFSSVFEPVYLAGIAAGSASESGILGYVYAFPIPQTLENINAFQLGAQTVNPDVKVIAVATASWCEPAKQAQAAQTLLDQGADVLTQHQDCTKTIIEAAEAAGAYSVGYHYDASELAPEGWLTGSEWAWTDLYTDIIATSVAGSFVDSAYNGDYRFGYRDVAAPFVAFKPSVFGPAITADTQAAITEAYDLFFADADGDGSGDFSVFTGPLADRDGTERIPDGVAPNYVELDGYFAEPWFVAGIEGSLG